MRKKIIFSSICVALCFLFTGCKSSDYRKATKLMEKSNYQEALELYKGISGYKNSDELATQGQELIDEISIFDEAKTNAELQIGEVDEAIRVAEETINQDKIPLDSSLIPSLETEISNAKALDREIPELPKNLQDIKAAVEEMNSMDYSEDVSNLISKTVELEKSISQFELVNAPSEAYIIKCLKKVDSVIDISAVTEDNDPNGKLNKKRGYTAQVFFSSDLVDQENFLESSTIEKGTACGGSIEVYANVDDANMRNDYLASFDGTILSNGSHTVVGTVVVRTSDSLTASKQKELEKNIIEELTNGE